MDEFLILKLAVTVLVLWIIFKFYWLRVLSCIFLLIAWGSFAIGGTLYVTVLNFGEGAVFQAIISLVLGFLLGGIWLVAAHAAYKWYRFEKKYTGGFWKPWNTQ